MNIALNFSITILLLQYTIVIGSMQPNHKVLASKFHVILSDDNNAEVYVSNIIAENSATLKNAARDVGTGTKEKPYQLPHVSEKTLKLLTQYADGYDPEKNRETYDILRTVYNVHDNGDTMYYGEKEAKLDRSQATYDLIYAIDFLDLRIANEEDGEQNKLLENACSRFPTFIKTVDDVKKILNFPFKPINPTVFDKIAYYTLNYSKILEDLVKNGNHAAPIKKLENVLYHGVCFVSDRFTLMRSEKGRNVQICLYDSARKAATKFEGDMEFLGHPVEPSTFRCCMSPDETYIAYFMNTGLYGPAGQGPFEDHSLYCLNIKQKQVESICMTFPSIFGPTPLLTPDPIDPIIFDQDNKIQIKLVGTLPSIPVQPQEPNGIRISYDIHAKTIGFDTYKSNRNLPPRQEKKFGIQQMIKSLNLYWDSTKYVKEKKAPSINTDAENFTVTPNNLSYTLFACDQKNTFIFNLIPDDLKPFIDAYNNNTISYIQALYLRAAQLTKWNSSDYKEFEEAFKPLLFRKEALYIGKVARLQDLPPAQVQTIKPESTYISEKNSASTKIDYKPNSTRDLTHVLKLQAPPPSFVATFLSGLYAITPTFIQQGITATKTKFNNLYNQYKNSQYQQHIKGLAGVTAIGTGAWLYSKYKNQ